MSDMTCGKQPDDTCEACGARNAAEIADCPLKQESTQALLATQGITAGAAGVCKTDPDEECQSCQ